ncbi:hypothetical protein ACIA98_16210 [Streptomyces sp. NPDC051366]|uniref:hypothetical protein n=1 Tax=Streptomyces sp. NPDC051366 TaxID=3365652 RepID=UPI00378CAF0F
MARQPKKAVPAKKRTHAAPNKAEPEGLTKADLYEKATAAHTPGRSTVTRDELQQTLARNRTRRRPDPPAASHLRTRRRTGPARAVRREAR